MDGAGGVDGAVSAAGGLAPDAGAAAESDASALASQPPLPRTRFWADRSHDATPADAAPGDASHPAPAPLGAVDRDALTGDAGHREARRSANASLDGAEQVGPTATSGDAQRLAATSRRTAARDMRRADSAEAGAVSAPSGAVVAAVRLGGGVTLVLDQGGGVPDIARLVAAAVPLLAELGRQGLLNQPASGDEL
ncbi:hypothetical protein GCM10009554_35020 [Kribbella koreensis]|uniref:Uncharacterized protein n=1 Tax=Kribbella koreensis TaxID=57909 RepID=A0ABN1QHW4_9ACTN